MKNLKLDYGKVGTKTAAIQKSANDNLKTYSKDEYKKLKEAMKTSKGDYKDAIVKELEEERKAVEAAADMIIKLHNMINKTAQSYQKVDASYTKGAKMTAK